jgi:heme/copper-type cytochrome/quinol oxidase subunit 4
MPQLFRDELADRRRTTLVLFYFAAILSAVAISLAGRILYFRAPLFVLAVGGVAAAILLLLHFLRSNDEREKQINYRALTFAFVGTLLFSATVGLFQNFGFQPVSWLGIPAFMIISWSIALVLYSWRYR